MFGRRQITLVNIQLLKSDANVGERYSNGVSEWAQNANYLSGGPGGGA